MIPFGSVLLILYPFFRHTKQIYQTIYSVSLSRNEHLENTSPKIFKKLRIKQKWNNSMLSHFIERKPQKPPHLWIGTVRFRFTILKSKRTKTNVIYVLSNFEVHNPHHSNRIELFFLSEHKLHVSLHFSLGKVCLFNREFQWIWTCPGKTKKDNEQTDMLRCPLVESSTSSNYIYVVIFRVSIGYT